MKPSLKLAKKQRNNTITGDNKGGKPLTLSKQGLDTLRKPFWYDGHMLEGKCPKCGARYFGWALRFPRNQSCSRCGAGLEIIEDGHQVSRGYSPFTAKKYSINLPTNVPPAGDKKKDTRVLDE